MTEYADQIIGDALASVTCGLRQEQVEQIITKLQDALKKQAECLADAKYDPAKADMVGRTAAYSMKTLDGLLRLSQFAKGQPDSRPDLGSDWLKALTDDQFQEVQRWVEANLAADEAESAEDPAVEAGPPLSPLGEMD